MKYIVALCVLILVACLNADARITYEISAKGAFAKVKFRVVDQDGAVVPGAKIRGGFTCGSRMNDYVLVDGTTNTNGEYIAEGKCNEFLRVDVTKAGYYHTEEKINFRRSKEDPVVVGDKWQPYGEMRTVVLKQIRNPWKVKSFGEGTVHLRIPVFGEWIGFDFEQGDWLQPYGRGMNEDVLVRFKSSVRKHQMDFTHVMEVSFTNNPYAGFYQRKKDASSDLRSDYFANSNAVFETGMVYVQEKLEKSPRRWDFLDKDSYLVFRTRTRVDENGNLKAAHYGKIYGYWCSDDKEMTFGGGCFNPVENDTNIEGDQSLLYKVRNYKDAK